MEFKRNRNLRKRNAEGFEKYSLDKESIELKLNDLLNFFGVTGILESTGNGYILDKNNNIVGSVEFKNIPQKAIIFDKILSEREWLEREYYQIKPQFANFHSYDKLKISFLSEYGKITSEMPIDFEWKHEFVLENDLGTFSGTLSGMNFDLPHTKMGFKLEKTQDKNIAETICICDNNEYFSYNNLTTFEKINIMKVKHGQGYRFIASKKNDENTKDLFIMSNMLGTYVETISLCNNGEYQDTKPYIKQLHVNLPIWQQMTNTINLLYPDVYRRIPEIIRTYDYNGTNIIETAIERVISPTISEEQLRWCYGEEIAKKLVKKGT